MTTKKCSFKIIERGANNEKSPTSLKNIMTDETMTQFKAEGDPIFPLAENNEKENSTESSTEKTPAESTPSPEEDKEKAEDKTKAEDKDNLADHPRWQEREKDWNKRFNDQEQRHVSEIEKLRTDLETKIGERTKKSTDTPIEVPPWFGGDESAWKQFLEWNESQVGRVKSDALNEIKSKSDADQKAIDDATIYFNETVVAIESDKTINPDGVKVDRNKLLKFVLDNDLVDSKGRWNYKAGFQMMRNSATTTKKDTIDEKKKIAGATTSENRGETKQPSYSTSADFKKPGSRPW